MSNSKICIKDTPIKLPLTIRLYADVHYGSPECLKDLFKKHVAQGARKHNTIHITLGDMIEAIGPRDPRYDPDVVDTAILDQSEDLLKILQPLKNKDLFMITGNHEDVRRRMGEGDYTRHWAARLNAQYLGYEGVIQLSLIEDDVIFPYTIFGHHGKGAGYYTAGKLHNLFKFSMWQTADLFIMGHVHDSASQKSPRRNGLEWMTQNYIIVPPYVDRGDYAVRAGHRPSEVGCVEVKVFIVDDPRTGKRRLQTDHKVIGY